MNNWQKQKIEQGLCLQCGRVPFGGDGGTKNRCASCATKSRDYNRNRYRIAKGIPLDKPVSKPKPQPTKSLE
jgi:hypothetical protein